MNLPAEDVRRDPESENHPRQLDARAAAFWRFAGDCERWGLTGEAEEARAAGRALRVRALLIRARMAGEKGRVGEPR